MSENLRKAKTNLIINHPFFASILLHMNMIEDPNIPTMKTDGTDLTYNPEFIEKHTVPETIFLLAHEVLHCALEHPHRRAERDNDKWNIACDYAVNQLLVDEKIGIAPQGVLLNKALVDQGNGTAEGIYRLLPDNPGDGKGQGKNPSPSAGMGQGKGKGKGKGQGQGNGQSDPNQDPGQDDQSQDNQGQGDGNGQGKGKHPGPGEKNGPLDQIDDAGPDQSTISEKREEMKVRVMAAANAAKMQGKLPGNLQRLVDEAKKPSVNWKDVLREFMTSKAKVEYSYAKPKRRFLYDDDIILPSLAGTKTGPIVIPIDCSGSIGQHELNGFAAEVRSIVEDLKPEEVHIIYFDTRVVRHDVFKPEDNLEFHACGGGGTAFSPFFEYINEKEINPVACVVLTDLCCNDFGPAPEYPVLWASTHGTQYGNPPFGDTIDVKIYD